MWNRLIILVFLMAASMCGGCFTIALEGTDIASRKAAESSVPVLKQTGEVTQKGVKEVKAAKEKVIEKVKEAAE